MAAGANALALLLANTDGIGDKIAGFLDAGDLVTLTQVSTDVAASVERFILPAIQRMASSGHGLSRHCLPAITLGFNPGPVFAAFGKIKGGTAINKIKITLGNKLDPVAEITRETILRLRVIGIDPITKILADDPTKCTSCAFRSQAAFELAARKLTLYYALLRSQKEGVRSCELEIGGHRISFQYSSSKGGCAIYAPVSAVFGSSLVENLIGFVPTFKFVAIAATIRDLAPKAPTAILQTALLVRMSEAVSDVADFTNGWIKAIIKVAENGDLELFSMYPEPPKH